MRTDDSANYSAIHANFLANFGHVYSVSEVIDKVRKTTFYSAKTSVMGYILKMQEFASRAAIGEEQTVRFIIEGFQDTSAHIAILYPAQTIVKLKELAHRYVQLREANTIVQSNSSFRPKLRPSSATHSNSGASGSSVDSGTTQTQCYNCSGYGHFAKDCSAPKRDKGSCFRCG